MTSATRVEDSSEKRAAGSVAIVLCEELSSAMEALSANKLQEFNEHILRQEVLCADLESTLKGLPASCTGSVDIEEEKRRQQIMGEFLTAIKHLQVVTRQYKALLRNSSRTITMLQTLAKTYVDGWAPYTANASLWPSEK